MVLTCDAASRESLMEMRVALRSARRDRGLHGGLIELAGLRRAHAELEYASDALVPRPSGAQVHVHRARFLVSFAPVARDLRKDVLALAGRAEKLEAGRVVGLELVRVLVVDVKSPGRRQGHADRAGGA